MDKTVGAMMFDVLMMGELNVDLVFTNLLTPPIPGRESIAKNCSLVLGSSTAISACVGSSLGLKTAFYGKLGKDYYGETVLSCLRKYDVDISNIDISKSYETGITVSMSMGKDRCLVTYFGSTIDGFHPDEADISAIPARHLHVGSYFLMPKFTEGMPNLFRRAKDLGMTTSLDAGWDESENWDCGLKETLKYTDLFFPNEQEALKITRCSNAYDAAKALAGFCKIAVVKCGPRGAVVCSDDKIISALPYDCEVLDTTGAGDNFNAGFLYGYLKFMQLEECLKYGNAVASISVTRIGGSKDCPTLEEVKRVIYDGRVYF